MINAIISFIWGVGITLLVIKLHQIYRYKNNIKVLQKNLKTYKGGSQ
jgi:hypothetical protein